MGNKELINVGLSSTTGEFDFVGVWISTKIYRSTHLA